MIQITVTRSSSKERIMGLRIEGHSGLASKGEDILCAAVSVLAENLPHSLASLLDLPVQTKADDGFFETLVASSALSEKSELLFASTLLGLATLREQYRHLIEIKEEFC